MREGKKKEIRFYKERRHRLMWYTVGLPGGGAVREGVWILEERTRVHRRRLPIH